MASLVQSIQNIVNPWTWNDSNPTELSEQELRAHSMILIKDKFLFV